MLALAVLGCSHFCLLSPLVQRLFGEEVQVFRTTSTNLSPCLFFHVDNSLKSPFRTLLSDLFSGKVPARLYTKHDTNDQARHTQ